MTQPQEFREPVSPGSERSELTNVSATVREGQMSRADLRERVASLRLPVTETSPRGSRLVWSLMVLLLVTNGVTGYLLLTRGEDFPVVMASADEVPVTTPASAAPPVSPERAPAVALESKGYVIPTQQILVTPKVSGMVVELNFAEGMRVRKGDVLAVIESVEFQADRDRAAAHLELARQRLLELEQGARPEEILQAEAELAEARIHMEEAERDHQRVSSLAEENATTRQALTAAESTLLAARQRVARLTHAWKLLKQGARAERIAAARAEMKQAQAELDLAEWRLGNSIIRAPISGTILKKNAEEGNIVNAAAFNGSFSLCEMADLSDLEVQLDIQERDVHRVFPGQQCVVRSEAWPDRRYEGIVSRLMPIADRAKGAVPVRVKIQIPSGEEGVYLKPEMGAIVTFRTSPPSSP